MKNVQWAGVWLAVGLGIGEVGRAAEWTAAQLEFFEKRVRPVLVRNCHGCHSAETKPSGGLRVDDRNGLLRGGESGPAVVAGAPEKSGLLERVSSGDARRRMPKEGNRLTAEEVADLRAWIKDGAAWPEEKSTAAPGRQTAGYERLRARHWAWQPLTAVKTPEVRGKEWAAGVIDRFVQAKLEERQMVAAKDADDLTLVRRLTYDLTGLPPMEEEIEGYRKDRKPGAYERLVDRLLASPRFGEQWARHWLDVARYAESTGPSRNIPYPHAWKYRDYVVDAVNRDVGFDRFIVEQIAGDLLAAETVAERERLQTATGFLALGPKDVNQRFKERYQMDNVAEQIDTVTRSVLALTVGCARCHDHKFDPIPTADYYRLAGIFASTEDAAGLRSKMGGAGLDYYDPQLLVKLATAPEVTVEGTARIEAAKKDLAEAKRAWDAIRGTAEGLAKGPDGKPKQQPYRLKYERMQSELMRLTDPAARGYAVHGAREGKAISDTAIRLRGETERMGPVVKRGFPTVFAVEGAAEVNPDQSGRLELARWLTSRNNPLTPRVAVNRVWSHLFGQGLVKTVDNFGVLGDRPSHPELLDYLAKEFVEDGWSVKRLVRRIVLSRTYRQSGDVREGYLEKDPENRLLWRHAPRRLTAEEIRDSVLATAGTLEAGGKSKGAKELPMVELRDDGREARQIRLEAEEARCRSLYLPLLRGLTPGPLEPFDPVTATMVTGQREATTVPGQALFLMNSVFVRKQSLALAEHLVGERERTEEERTEKAYRRVLGRAPSGDEYRRAKVYLKEYEDLYRRTARPEREEPSKDRRREALAEVPTANQEDDRIPDVVAEERVEAKGPREAAWMSLVQALYASAEFRYVR